MKGFLKMLGVAALGGALTGGATYDPNKPFTSGNVLKPIGAGAFGAVIGLFIKNPFSVQR